MLSAFRSLPSRLLPALVLLLCAATAPAAGTGREGDAGWVATAKARSPEDISLWTRYIDGAPLKAFRGATHTAMPAASVLALLQDTNATPQWLFRCDEARVLKRDDYGDSYVYMSFRGIWPLEDRDAVIRMHPEYDARTGEIRLVGVAAPDYLPRVPGKVRIPSIHSEWRLRPVDGNLVRLEMSGHVDPAGSVPLWLANLVVNMVPRHSLKNIHGMLPQYRDGPLVRDSETWLQGLRQRR